MALGPRTHTHIIHPEVQPLPSIAATRWDRMLQSYASSDANALNGLDHTHKDERSCWWVPARRSYSDDSSSTDQSGLAWLPKTYSTRSSPKQRRIFTFLHRQPTDFSLPARRLYIWSASTFPLHGHYCRLASRMGSYPSSCRRNLLAVFFATLPRICGAGLTAPHRWNFRLGRRMSTSIKSTLA
jgi:hypothetical protein